MAPLILLALIPAGAAGAPPITADQALTNYRKLIKTTRELDCPSSGSADEIVVCGNRDDETQSARLPLPVEPEPGARRGLIAGEPPSATGAMSADHCISRCPGNVGVNLLAIPGFIGKVIERLKDE
ncbi:MAG: hypothetical protein M3N39_14955 [Pseudomonadota bacterium]|nr:hypothetical protein [Pseudomonadota bacterium]